MTDPGPETIPALVAAAAAEHGDRVAVVEGDLTLTYGELAEGARGVAAALVASGVEAGDRVALWAPNSARWIVAVLGVFEAGATLVPVNTRFKGTEAADILGRAGVTALVTVTDFLGADHLAMLEGAAEPPELPALTTRVVVEGPVPEGAVGWDEFVVRGDDGARAEVERRVAALTGDSVSDILFTSGTTGVPKGVVQTHRRTLGVALDWVAMVGLRADDRYLMVNPYFHMFGLKAGILPCVATGATMLPEPVFDVDRVLARVGPEGVTVLPGAPTIYQSILEHPDRGDHDLSSLRLAVTGAADIPVELIRRIYAELPFEVVVAGYGLTEAGTVTATAPGDDPEVVATTVGRPRPAFELRIDGAEGEPGEILVRGPTVMAGYLDDPEATAEALSADGWLRTGDLGVIGDDGNLRIVGRVKDMFIVGGFNAYPAEIENLLLGHPDVAQAAVIGIPDERLGEVGMAFVVAAPGSSPTEAEIVEWARANMANYKAPRQVRFLAELPVNATGKVEKTVLRAQL